MSTKTKRVITLEDRQNALRLKSIWNRQKSELGLTQMSAAALCGFSQPTFNQYLNCVIPLNTDAIIKLSMVLQVNPIEIAPSFKNVSPLFSIKSINTEKITIPILGTTSGDRTMQTATLRISQANATNRGSLAGIAIDSAIYKASLGYPTGTVVVVDLLKDPYLETHNAVIKRTGQDNFELIRIDKLFKLTLDCVLYANMECVKLHKADILLAYPVSSVVMP